MNERYMNERYMNKYKIKEITLYNTYVQQVCWPKYN